MNTGIPDIRKELKHRILVIDGAMGTAIQAAGLAAGEFAESFNFRRPDVIRDIHMDYVEAGCDVITTNTFSSNAIKLEGQSFTVEESIRAGVQIAKVAAKKAAGDREKNIYIAHGLGPTGELMSPLGSLDFDRVYEIFKEQIVIAESAGAHMHLFETFSDISELRAGIIAAKENSDLPVFCSVTMGGDERMLLGTDPETIVYMLQDMGIDALGVNCSLGPAELIPIIQRMLKVSKIPIFVQPNAGMPREDDGRIYYDVTPEEFVRNAEIMLRSGIAAIGGCCGTYPEYTRQLVELVEKLKEDELPGLSKKWYRKKIKESRPSACSVSSSAVFGEETVIMGERLNPTGRRDMKDALKSEDWTFIENEAVIQAGAGAHIININVGMEGIDDLKILEKSIQIVSDAVSIPVQVDSSNPTAIENAVRKYKGKPIINSVNGEQSSMDKVFPIVEKYGTAVVALTLDENGIPNTVEDRLSILDKIIKEAAGYGITKDRLIVDTLTLTVSTDPDSARKTLDAVRKVSEGYGMETILGASNISFGLPERDRINRAFLSMAVQAGLSSVITDPTKTDLMDEIKAAEVLAGTDPFAERYIWYNKAKDGDSNSDEDAPEEEDSRSEPDLKQIILDGRVSKAEEAVRELLNTRVPLEIINEIVIPSLELVGESYERGNTFLPEMIKSADAVKRAFDVLNPVIAESGESISKGRVILATVEGDIHDIGKNIVRTILENYGYDVLDLGKDVALETIIETARSESIRLVGLSALMTTTMVNMKPVIDAINEEGLDCKVAVGGAVLTQEYADRIKADFYCETAMDTVRAAEKVFL